MSRLIRVTPPDLVTSAAQVHGHAAEVEAGHGLADARIQAAQAGLVGLSAVAVATKLAQWQATTQALCARLSDHAQALQVSGVGFQGTETRNAESVAGVGEHGGQTAVSSLAG